MNTAYLETGKPPRNCKKCLARERIFYELKCGNEMLSFEVSGRLHLNEKSPFITLTVYLQTKPLVQYRDHFSLHQNRSKDEWAFAASHRLGIELTHLHQSLTLLEKHLVAHFQKHVA